MKFSTFQKKRVVMATIGSLGDLHPYISLALEMKKRYIEPVIATSNTYRERVESLDIEFHPIRPNMPETGTPEYQKIIDGVVDPNRGAEYLFKRVLIPAVRDMYADLSTAIEGAVLLVGNDQNRPKDRLPEEIIAVNYAPLGELLPRAAVMVHQGGVGTTGQGLRAGIPMLVLPFAHDQHDNGWRVERLGVARTIARNSYKAERVASELKELLGNPAYSRNAREIGSRVRSERGAAHAVDLILDRLNERRSDRFRLRTVA